MRTPADFHTSLHTSLHVSLFANFLVIFLAIVVVILALPAADARAADIVLRAMGSFHVGGRVVAVHGKEVRDVVRVAGGPSQRVDPNGDYQVEQMYVQYFLPRDRKGTLPLLMWHGGGLTGVTFETTPDGREGWLNMFVRKGFDVYVSDAVERGRSGFASEDVWPGERLFLTYADPFERFRIGTGAGSWDPDPAKRKLMPGVQFPVDAYANFMKQTVPRWLDTDDAVIAAYGALVDAVCPCVLLTHSQGGSFGFKVAEARADRIKAIVAVESAGAGDPGKAAALKDVPVLMMFGDNVNLHPRWVAYRKLDLDYAAAVRAAGGKVDVVDLPNLGIRGNSHMVMMDRNNDAVADVIANWLAERGLVAQ